ncbi:MAG: hypothetical protein WAU68_04120 [Vitreimonas sp.]
MIVNPMPPHAPSPAKLHALARLLTTNLVVFAAWVVEWSAWWPFQAAVKRRLRKQLRRGARAFAQIVFLLAAARVAPPLRMKRTHHPANAPPGFRLQISGKARRFIHISGQHEGSLKSRIARLQRRLRTIALWVARFIKRLHNCAKKSRLVLTHAIVEACAVSVCAPEPCAADTS